MTANSIMSIGFNCATHTKMHCTFLHTNNEKHEQKSEEEKGPEVMWAHPITICKKVSENPSEQK